MPSRQSRYAQGTACRDPRPGRGCSRWAFRRCRDGRGRETDLDLAGKLPSDSHCAATTGIPGGRRRQPLGLRRVGGCSSWNLEQEVTSLRRQLTLAQEEATRAAEEAANALREARTRIDESEASYFETPDQLRKALDDRRRLADLLGRMRDRWLTASGRAASAESQEGRRGQRWRAPTHRRAHREGPARGGSISEMETQAAEAARLADTRIQDLAHQLQAAAEGAAALRTELREAQTAVQAFQDRYATLHQERDRLVEERDGATAAVRSAEAAKTLPI